MNLSKPFYPILLTVGCGPVLAGDIAAGLLRRSMIGLEGYLGEVQSKVDEERKLVEKSRQRKPIEVLFQKCTRGEGGMSITSCFALKLRPFMHGDV